MKEAEPIVRHALRINEQSYGPEHPKVAVSLNILGLLLLAKDELTEAEPVIRKALAINKKIYGMEHPNVARNLGNLAQLLQKKNRLIEAEQLMRQALSIYENIYDPKHPDIALAINNLARLLQAKNQLVDAEPLMRRAVLILLKSTHTSGHESPNLNMFYGNYQLLLTAQHLPPNVIAERLDTLGQEADYSKEEWQRLRRLLSTKNWCYSQHNCCNSDRSRRFLGHGS